MDTRALGPRGFGGKDVHIESIYAKIGVSTRAAAALFAMRHGIAGPAIGDAA